MRNVPVGGGCRRNKRNKSSNNNNNNAKLGGGGGQIGNSNNASSTSAIPSSTCSMEMIGSHFSQASTQFTPLMAAFQNLNNYGGLIHPPPNTHQLVGEMGFQLGNNNLLPSLVGSNFEHPTNLYPNFQGEGATTIEASNGVTQQVKMEDNNATNRVQGNINSSTKQFLGTLENNNQYWGVANANANSWIGFSGDINNNSSSNTTNHLL